MPSHHSVPPREVRIIGGLWKRTKLPVVDIKAAFARKLQSGKMVTVVGESDAEPSAWGQGASRSRIQLPFSSW